MADDGLDDLLDSIFAVISRDQEGVPSYRELRKTLAAALRQGDKKAELAAQFDLGSIIVLIARHVTALGGSDLGVPVPDRDDLLTRAASHFGAAHDAAAIARDDRMAALALWQLADCHLRAGRLREARQVLEYALHGYRSGDDAVVRSQLLSKLGDCALALGEYGRALEWYQAALQLAVELGDPAEEAQDHGNVASALFNLERFDRALEHYRQARDLWVRIRDDPPFREQIIFNPNMIELTDAEPDISYIDKRIELAIIRLRQVAELPRKDLIRARHAGYYLSQLNRAQHLFASENATERSTALENLDREWEQISQGQQWAAAHAEYGLAGEQGVGYALSLGSPLLSSRMSAKERQQWASAGLAVAERNEDRETQCSILINLSYDNVDLGNPEAAGQNAEQARRLARELGDAEREGLALIALSHLHSEQGHYELAHATLQDGRRLASGPGEATSKYLANQVSIYLRAGNYREGLELAERDLREAGRDRDVRREAVALGNLGTCLHALGDAQAALEHFERALPLARQVGDRRGEMADLGGAGAAHLDLQHYDQSQRLLQDALAVARELDDSRAEENALGNLALVFRATGRYDDAMRNLDAVLGMARRRNDQSGEIQVLLGMGGVHQEQEHYQEALECYERAADVARQFGNQAMQATSMVSMSQVALLMGHAEEAIRLLNGARDLAQKAGARGFEVIALMGLAATFGQIGRSSDGLKAAQEAREIAAALNDQVNLEALDKLIPLLTSAAREEEGRTARLETLVELGLLACRSLLQNGVGPYLATTEALTGPIPDHEIAAAVRALPPLSELLDQSQPEEDRAMYYTILSKGVNAAASAALEDPAAARLLAAADARDTTSHVMRVLGMRVAITAVAMFNDVVLASIAARSRAGEADQSPSPEAS